MPKCLHFLLQVSCFGFQYPHLMTSKENISFMNSSSGIKDTKKDSKHWNVGTSFQFMNHTTISSPKQKELQIYQFLPIFTNHTRNLQLFQFHSSVVVGLPHQKLGVLILQNRPRPSPSSVHSSRRSPELHFPEWWSGGCLRCGTSKQPD